MPSHDPKAPLDPFSHVADSPHVEVFDFLHFEVPFQSKFLLLLTLAGLIVLALYIPVAQKIKSGEVPRGRLWNALEFLLAFIRDQIARPALGEHDYRRFLPFLWTMFFFILVVNLLGMVPFMASATASLAVCGALALVSFVVAHYNGIVANHGVVGYLKTFVVHIEANDPLTRVLAPFITVGLFFLEILGAIIRGTVLAVRLFANILAGHTVLFILLAFIKMIGIEAGEGNNVANFLFWPVTTISVGMVTILSVLELFVACLQAFVFTFLTATFIGMAMHPQH